MLDPRVPTPLTGALLALAVFVAGCANTEHADRSRVRVDVSAGGCGHGWRRPHSGTQTFVLRNPGNVTVQADLIDPHSGAVYAEAEGMGPGTSRPIRLTLGRGNYAFRCLPEDDAAATGPTERVRSGPARGAPAAVPVPPAQLVAAVRAYNRYVEHGLGVLVTKTAALRRAARWGDRSATRRAWLPAHLAYERLGAAYGAFGDKADAIDGLPAGKPGGVDDPNFTGFHRLEYLLWRGGSMAAVRRATTTLQREVAALHRDAPRMRIDPNDLALRAHEILEQTLQFQLTGEADEGSGTTLATAAANVTGTEAVLRALRPCLRGRYRHLAAANRWLARTKRLIDGARGRDGHWTPVDRLGRSQRRKLNGAMSQTLELLAPVAAIAAVRRSR